MIFEIKEKNVELKFNLGAIRKLDEMYQAKVEGIEFGAGLMMANMQLQQFNPTALSNVIDASTPNRYTQDDIDKAVEEYAEENDGLRALFEEVSEELGKSKVVKDTIRRLTAMGGAEEEKE